jgi:hypothetical protein
MACTEEPEEAEPKSLTSVAGAWRSKEALETVAA